jgi:hypothetical protein
MHVCISGLTVSQFEVFVLRPPMQSALSAATFKQRAGSDFLRQQRTSPRTEIMFHRLFMDWTQRYSHAPLSVVKSYVESIRFSLDMQTMCSNLKDPVTIHASRSIEPQISCAPRASTIRAVAFGRDAPCPPVRAATMSAMVLLEFCRADTPENHTALERRND